MGYDHTMEGMSLKRHTSYHFCADAIMTIKVNEICGLFADVGPKIKRMNPEYKNS